MHEVAELCYQTFCENAVNFCNAERVEVFFAESAEFFEFSRRSQKYDKSSATSCKAFSKKTSARSALQKLAEFSTKSIKYSVNFINLCKTFSQEISAFFMKKSFQSLCNKTFR